MGGRAAGCQEMVGAGDHASKAGMRYYHLESIRHKPKASKREKVNKIYHRPSSYSGFMSKRTT